MKNRKKKNRTCVWLDMKERSLRVLCAVAALSVIMMSGGCTLAKEEAGAKTDQDRLIGVFVTTEYLDLFDFDAYLSDHANKLMSGGEHLIADGAKYEGKLYADIDKNDSSSPEDWKISFGDVDGMLCIAPAWTDENGENFRQYRGDSMISDVNLDHTVTDDGENMELSATIYVLPGLESGNADMEGMDSGEEAAYPEKEIFDAEKANYAEEETYSGGDMDRTEEIYDGEIFYANPVYQTEEGEIYMVSGSGFCMGNSTEEGECMSTTLSESYSNVSDGQTNAEASSVEITFSVMFEPVKITLLQMNDDDQILKADDYEPGKLPDSITAKEDTAYFLIRTEKADPEGGSVIRRELYEYVGDEQDEMETFYAVDSHTLGKQYTKILWQK